MLCAGDAARALLLALALADLCVKRGAAERQRFATGAS
jgi:hypothetical protein